MFTDIEIESRLIVIGPYDARLAFQVRRPLLLERDIRISVIPYAVIVESDAGTEVPAVGPEERFEGYSETASLHSLETVLGSLDALPAVMCLLRHRVVPPLIPAYQFELKPLARLPEFEFEIGLQSGIYQVKEPEGPRITPAVLFSRHPVDKPRTAATVEIVGLACNAARLGRKCGRQRRSQQERQQNKVSSFLHGQSVLKSILLTNDRFSSV